MVTYTARGLLELTRPVNAVVSGVLTATGSFVAGIGGQFPMVFAASAATVLAVGGGNGINDYFDREIDQINEPDRPIPRGAVSARGALVFSLVLFGAATALALTLPVVSVAIALVNLLALLSYTKLFKGLPGLGNALVAYLGGSTFLFGGAAVGGFETALVLGLLAAMSTLTREIIKDVEDIDGDRQEGLNTLPIAVGERTALSIGTIVLAVAVAASPLPFLLGTFDVIYLLLVGPADAIMLYACYESLEDPTAAQSHLKYGMFLAAAAFVVGRTAVIL